MLSDSGISPADFPPFSGARAKSELFSASGLMALRQMASDLWLPVADEAIPEGWSKSPVDPNDLLSIFSPLRLRKGYVLRAYVFRMGGNGNGVVWAMPGDAPFPAPEDCPVLENHFGRTPKPRGALDDPMEAIEGDGSAWSYMAASLLHRELREFGAAWHGIYWGTHIILDDDPWKDGVPVGNRSLFESPTGDSEQWKWIVSPPTQWRPQVIIGSYYVTITFHTYSGLGNQAIYRHTDTYRAGNYRPKVEQEMIAEGPSGFLF